MLPKMLNESSLQKCSHICFLKCFWTLTPFLFLEGKKHLLWNYVVDSVAPWQPSSLLYSIINSREWLHSILVRTQTHCNNTVCFGFASPLSKQQSGKRVVTMNSGIPPDETSLGHSSDVGLSFVRFNIVTVSLGPYNPLQIWWLFTHPHF